MMKRILNFTVVALISISCNIALAADSEPSSIWQDFKNYISNIFAYFNKPKESNYHLAVYKVEQRGDKQNVQIQLYKTPGNQPVTFNDLEEVHTQKLHLLIIDSSLEDYHHVHPTPTNQPGIYEFQWQPKQQDAYRMWADIAPLDTNRQEFVMADLLPGAKPAMPIDREPKMKSTVGNYNFKLYFDSNELRNGSTVTGHIIVTDLEGHPVKDLEPIMGAYAHLVGFYDDFKSIIHIHPMGEEPTQSSDRSGPEIIFFMDPEQDGFIKLFVQVKIGGQEVIAPFAFAIQPKKTAFKIRFGMESYDRTI